MKITSTRKSVIQRQIDYGVYNTDRFLYNAYSVRYWSSHLIEELCEYTLAESLNKAEEAADCIIFLQNLIAVICPDKKLVLNLTIPPKYIPIAEVIKSILELNNLRKDWKSYEKPELQLVSDCVTTIIGYLLWYVKPTELLKAYEFKVSKNVTRTDWNRKSV
jgi:hypothetical protein